MAQGTQDTEKTPRSINFEKPLLDWIDANYPNRSEYVNDLVRADMNSNGGVQSSAVQRFHQRRLETEKRSLESQLDAIEDELEDLTTQNTQQQEAMLGEIDSVIDDMVDSNATIATDAPRIERIARDYFSGDTETCISVLKERREERDIDAEVVR